MMGKERLRLQTQPWRYVRAGRRRRRLCDEGKRRGKGGIGATAHREAAGRNETSRGRTETRQRRWTPGRRRGGEDDFEQTLAFPVP
jgi:hypothetical protein